MTRASATCEEDGARVDWWTDARETFQALLEEYGLVAGFLIYAVDEAGVPMPVPGEIWLVLLGIQASQGQIPLWQVLLFMEIAAVVGGTIVYAVSARLGRRLVYRIAAVARINPEALNRAGSLLRRGGIMGVAFARLVPGLRIVTPIACGLFGIPLRVFLPGIGLGSGIYVVGYTLLGYALGPSVIEFIERQRWILGLLGWLVVLTVLAWFILWVRRTRESPTART